MRADLHQHFWTESLLDALAARTEVPFVRPRGGDTDLYCAGEPIGPLPVEGVAARRAANHRHGIDRAVIALSSPLGIEALPRAEAEALIDVHLRGVAELGGNFSAWGPVPLEAAAAADVDLVLGRGCVGVSLPAGALNGPEDLAELMPMLDRAAARGAPVLIHPGPGRQTPPRAADAREPVWWAAVTDYAAQMQAAWITFAAFGRAELPALKVVFAMLAGGAPLLSERLKLRGGPAIDPGDRCTFYDTSGYGPAAIEAMARRVGAEALVYGSDRPVVEPEPTGDDVIRQRAAAALLSRVPVPA